MGALWACRLRLSFESSFPPASSPAILPPSGNPLPLPSFSAILCSFLLLTTSYFLLFIICYSRSLAGSMCPFLPSWTNNAQICVTERSRPERKDCEAHGDRGDREDRDGGGEEDVRNEKIASRNHMTGHVTMASDKQWWGSGDAFFLVSFSLLLLSTSSSTSRYDSGQIMSLWWWHPSHLP